MNILAKSSSRNNPLERSLDVKCLLFTHISMASIFWHSGPLILYMKQQSTKWHWIILRSLWKIAAQQVNLVFQRLTQQSDRWRIRTKQTNRRIASIFWHCGPLILYMKQQSTKWHWIILRSLWKIAAQQVNLVFQRLTQQSDQWRIRKAQTNRRICSEQK